MATDKLTPEQVHAAYATAISVYKGELRASDGRRNLVEKHGINTNTAIDIITNVGHMLDGKLYNRKNSIYITQYYLERIHADFGSEALANAIQSVDLHLDYLLNLPRNSSRQPGIRKLLEGFRGKISSNTHPSLEQVREDLNKAVSISNRSSSAERRKRLQAADAMPKKVAVTTYTFIRNPDVISEALDRAKGHCEGCHKPAPFFRRNTNLPFLEVHHIIPLANEGPDTLDNVQALCPNCHRKAHYG